MRAEADIHASMPPAMACGARLLSLWRLTAESWRRTRSAVALLLREDEPEQEDDGEYEKQRDWHQTLFGKNEEDSLARRLGRYGVRFRSPT
jgi:hypothetical protein